MSKKAKKAPFQPLSLKSYIIERARKLPIYKCWSVGDQESGAKQILVARQKANGMLVVGFYLVDFFCLGVKDTFYREFEDEAELKEIAFQDIPKGIELEEIDAIYAQNLIYGAVEYAEDLGFKPHKEFRITEYLLDDVESIEYMDIEFGEDGQPHYVAGEDDDVDKNLKILTENVGIGNFTFTNPMDEAFDLTEEEKELEDLEALDEEQLLQKIQEKTTYLEAKNPLLLALWGLHLAILLEIEKIIGDSGDDLEELYSENPVRLIADIKDACIANLSEIQTILGENLNKTIIILIEQHIENDCFHFVFLDDYEKALQSFLDNEPSHELYRFMTTFKEKSVLMAFSMLSAISKQLFGVDDFDTLTNDQKEQALTYFFVEINNDEPSAISDDYQESWEEFSYFNSFVTWEEDVLRNTLLTDPENL